ncbi:MAG: LysM peptidoglycan-binding domain-containing protein, partial [Anaerolineaceae bacterium]|nr:LysM peptidoglycan-binding domain-containing protein [Anaerolineaceae bacterium]
MTRKLLGIIFTIWALVGLSCTRTGTGSDPWRAAPKNQPGQATEPVALQATGRPPARLPGSPVLTPTPDPPREMPTARVETEEYIVQPNDTLGIIARRYGVNMGSLIAANKIDNPDHLEVGQVLTIPAPDPLPPGPDFKIIPDSELVYSPASVGFDIAKFVNQANGYLNHYREEVNGRSYTGANIVERVAEENSVNPRLLL